MTQESLVEVGFTFHVHTDAETARRVLHHDARVTSAVLYQAADHWATEAVNPDEPLFIGKLAHERAVSLRWVGDFLVWAGGFVCGAVAAGTVSVLLLT